MKTRVPGVTEEARLDRKKYAPRLRLRTIDGRLTVWKRTPEARKERMAAWAAGDLKNERAFCMMVRPPRLR